MRGEWAELVFMMRAMEHGLPISKPWGDSRSFDFVVGSPGHFMAVQVKSTVCELGAGYACTLRGSQSRRYGRGAFDFLAGYVVVEDCWYIVPARVIEGMERISLASDSERAHYEEYREAWHLLQPAKRKSSMIDRIEACAEDIGWRMSEPVSAVPRFGGMVGRLLWRESAAVCWG
jgi:DNA-binding cell septation regulator SpoVG